MRIQEKHTAPGNAYDMQCILYTSPLFTKGGAVRMDLAVADPIHLVGKPVAWPGTNFFSYRTRNGVTEVPGYVVYSVVSSTHNWMNVLLCSGSHKITCSHPLCDSTGVLHHVKSHELLIPAATIFKTSLSCCRYSRPEDEAVITVSGEDHEGICNVCQPALAEPGIVDDLPICRVTAATVRRSARQPKRRHCRLQPSRRAGCEAAREGRGSHAARLKGWTCTTNS